MKVLLTGGSGLVGSCFKNITKDDNNLTVYSPNSSEMDITNISSIKHLYHAIKPDVTVHLSAYTDVSSGEIERNTKSPCWITNVEGTKNLLDVHKLIEKPFIYISTDSVFSGLASSPGPYTESSSPESDSSKVSWYGWTKYQGEKNVQKYLNNYSIIRISNPVQNIYPSRPDYFTKAISRYNNNHLVKVFNNQYLTITYVNELVSVITKLLKHPKTGVFHVSSSDVGTPLEITEYLLKTIKHTKVTLSQCSIEEYIKISGNKTRYPQYGGLDTKWTQEYFGINFLNWHEIIDQFYSIRK